MELKLSVDGLEKERDFYFSKLRDIELICQEHENENNPIITGIIEILYATEVQYHMAFYINETYIYIQNLLFTALKGCFRLRQHD